jgi:hypothetical protein
MLLYNILNEKLLIKLIYYIIYKIYHFKQKLFNFYQIFKYLLFKKNILFIKVTVFNFLKSIINLDCSSKTNFH